MMKKLFAALAVVLISTPAIAGIIIDHSTNTISTDTGSVTLGVNASGPVILDEAASVTNPTLVPDKTDLDTGIGGDGANSLSLITGGSEAVHVDSGQNMFVIDGGAGTGALVVGHTAQVTVGSTAKFQVLGTGGSDSAVIIGRWQNNAFAPKISFAKSRGATIGASVIVNDNDVVGLVRFCPDDGVGFTTLAAQFSAEVDDATPAVGDIGMAFTWEQMDGEGGVLKETMRLAAKGNLGIGVAPNVNRQLDLGGTFNGNTRFSVTDILQSSAEAQQVFIGGTINAVADADIHGIRIAPTLVEAGSGTHANFNSLVIVPPVVTVGVATLTNASTVRISGAPTGATNNNSLWVTGNIKLDGSSGGCFMIRDTDDAGWSKGTLLNGVVTWETDADGIC